MFLIRKVRRRLYAFIYGKRMFLFFMRFFSKFNVYVFHEKPKGADRNKNPLLERYRNIYKGKTCVILGSAPSVGNVDLSLIKDHYIFALNKAYLLYDRIGRCPDSLVIADPHAAAEYGDEAINSSIKDVFFSEQAYSLLSNKYDEVNVFSYFKSPRMHQGFFQFDIVRPLYQSSTVAHYALQIANYMGFSKIVMIGVDLDFNKDCVHFYEGSTEERERAILISMMKKDFMVQGIRLSNEIIGGDVLLFKSGNKYSSNPLPYISLDKI